MRECGVTAEARFCISKQWICDMNKDQVIGAVILIGCLAGLVFYA